MTDRLSVHTDGVLNSSELYAQVGSGLSGLTAPEPAGVQTSHGAIASAVSGALGTVLSGRGDTIGATSTSASTIADLLQKSARAYAAGDEEGGSRLRAAADALDGKGQPGAEACAPTTAAAGGADPMGQLGQIMGQVGQLGGALAQSVTAPLQGLAQGLQQVPQQIMAGVQQAAQAAQSAKLDAADEKPETTPDREDQTEPQEEAEPEPVREAQAGQRAPGGTAPVEAPPTGPQPAPTRPQID